MICSGFTNSINNIQKPNPILQNILQSIHNPEPAYNIEFLYTRSRQGFIGNEEADKLAKQSITEGIANIPVLVSVLKKYIKKTIHNYRNIKWKDSVTRLRAVKHDGNPWRLTGNRKEQIKITRLAIGHTVDLPSSVLE